MQIPPIKIINSGETFFINKATNSTYVEKNDDIMETTQSDGGQNIPIHQEESWTVATSSKKRKVTPLASARKIDTYENKTMATRYQAAQSIQRTARRGSNGPNGKSDKPYSQTTTDIHRRENN